MEFIYKGQWILPEDPENVISGTLKFDYQNGATLELSGAFEKSALTLGIIDILLGVSTSGIEFTLCHCIEVNRKEGRSSQFESTWIASYIIRGAHFASFEEMKFTRASVCFKNLNEWLGKSGFSDFKWICPQHAFEIQYIKPSEMRFEIDDNITIGFRFDINYPKYQFTFDFEQRSVFVVESRTQPLNIGELFSYISAFDSFLTLATFQPTYPLFTTLISPNKTLSLEGKQHSIQLHIYFPNKYYKNEDKSPYWFLFGLADIEHQIEAIILSWFRNNNELEPVIDLFVDYIREPLHFNNGKFLNLMHAIETFHRRRRNNCTLSEKEHKKRLKEILHSVPEEHKKFLSNRLQKSNEPSLNDRLTELLDEFNVPLVGKYISDKQSFVREIKTSRNYYTHYDSSLEGKALKGNELYDATEKIKLILIFCILTESGISKEKLDLLLSAKPNRFIRARRNK